MMKRLLLSAALGALMSVSAAYAQETTPVVYSQGAALSSIDDLTSGTYFIRVHCNNTNGDMARGEKMLQHTSDAGLFNLHGDYDIATATTGNTALIWKIEVTDGTQPDDWDTAGYNSGTFNGKVFTVQNVGTGAYMSLRGLDVQFEDGPSRGNIATTTDVAQAAKFQLVSMPEDYIDYYGTQKENTRFFFQLTNSLFHNKNNGRIAYPFVHTNADPDENKQNTKNARLSYWADYNTVGTAVQFDLVKADEVNAVPVIVKFPAINGIAVPDQIVNMPLGKSYAEPLEAHIEDMNRGDFHITNVTSSTGSTTITEENQVLTLEGSWAREFKPNQVFRLRFNPSAEAEGTVRYMISTGKIETRRENRAQTINRLVPERLWYFLPVEGEEGCYTMHTLYDTEKAIYYANTENQTDAELKPLAQATAFKFMANENGTGDFVLEIVGDDSHAKANDFGGQGFMRVWRVNNTTDAGSQIRVYALEDADFDVLADFGTAEEIAAAKANPTPENVKPLIDAYNAQNLTAALKRVEYLFNGTIGNNPGQYSDKTGEFAANVEYAREILAKGDDATEEELLAAVEGIDITGVSADDLTFNEMTTGLYRFRNKANNKYLSALSGGSAAFHQAMAITTDGTRSNTIFYVVANDENEDPSQINYTVIAYENGLVLPRMNGGTGNTESWMPTMPDNELASDAVHYQYKDDGCFVFHTGFNPDNTHRHIHGGGNGTTANCGGGDDNDYRWHIERVNELPITFYNVIGMDDEYDNDGWASVYAPVAIEVPADRHITAYTGEFDDTDYTGKADINHILATEIAPVDGKVVIPAGQVALFFFDGEADPEDPNDEYINPSLMGERSHITYINLPVDYNYTGETANVGNLKGSYTAINNASGTDYFTLHASHINNFREYSYYAETQEYPYIPGFKAYIDMPHVEDEEETMYPVYTINPNKIVTVDGEEGFNVAKTEEGKIVMTVTTPTADYDVYYKQTSVASNVQRRAVAKTDHTGYEKATKEGNVHTITLEKDGNVEYYAYHPEMDIKGAVRTATVDTTGITEVTAEDAAKVYDLQGRRLDAPAKGINIVNSKKVLVK